MLKSFRLLLCLLLATSAEASTKYKTTSSTEGHLEFLALGRPAMIRIKGESVGPDGVLTLSEGFAQAEFHLKLAELNTGIEMRDKHMKEKYLEIEKNPEAILTIENLTLKSQDQDQDVPFEGQLALHGQNKKVNGLLSYKTSSSAQKTAHAEFKFKLSEFAISIPSYAGITVADEVQIKLDLNLKPE